jgi:hypothetical protein
MGKRERERKIESDKHKTADDCLSHEHILTLLHVATFPAAAAAVAAAHRSGEIVKMRLFA